MGGRGMKRGAGAPFLRLNPGIGKIEPGDWQNNSKMIWVLEPGISVLFCHRPLPYFAIL